MSTVVLVGTFDTKGGEFIFVRDKILSLDLVGNILLIDVGIRSTSYTIPHPDIDARQIMIANDYDYERFKSLSKGEALKVMSCGLERILIDLHTKGNLHGVFGMGGGCGSTLIASPFQKLPIGVPKMLLSTIIATGNARAYIGCTDMTVMYSVVDLSGKVNCINQQIITNAAVAIAAMTNNYFINQAQNVLSTNIISTIPRSKPLIVASMLGLTQPCVLAAEAQLDKLGYEFISFHCVGSGGEAMEKLIASGVVHGVLDVTLAEVMHNMIPGSLIATGPYRLEAAGRLGIPQVVSLGGLDMLTFGPWSAVPTEYRTRAKYENNANAICLRTSQDECARVGELIANKLNRSQGPVTLFIPRRGFSLLSISGNVLDDTTADECLFKALRAHIDSKVVSLVERDQNINDSGFGQALADALHEQLKHKLSAIDQSNN